MSSAQIEHHLTSARRAYREERYQDQREALDEAWVDAQKLGADHPLFHRIAWKRAKAYYLAQQDALPAIAPLFEAGLDPFAHYDSALPAAATLARHHQDTIGYGDPLVLQIWRSLAEHQRAQHHELGWGHAILQLAWDAACTGDLNTVDEHLGAVEGADLDVLMMDVAHTNLRATTWNHAPSRLDDALDLLQSTSRHIPPSTVVLEAQLEASVRFSLPLPPSYPTDTVFREAFQRVLRSQADPELAMQLGRPEGPEWALSVWSTMLLHGVDLQGGWELIESSGCLAFRPRSPSLP